MGSVDLVPSGTKNNQKNEAVEQGDSEASSLATWVKEGTVPRHRKVRRWVVMLRAVLHLRLW